MKDIFPPHENRDSARPGANDRFPQPPPHRRAGLSAKGRIGLFLQEFSSTYREARQIRRAVSRLPRTVRPPRPVTEVRIPIVRLIAVILLLLVFIVSFLSR